MTELLPGDTRMGRVSLDVADLDALTAFYRDVLLLQVLAERPSEVDLGRGGETLVTLRHRPDLPKGERRSAGLFHTAILHPDRAALAREISAAGFPVVRATALTLGIVALHVATR